MKVFPNIYYCGDNAMTLELSNTIDISINQRIHFLFQYFKQKNIAGIMDIIPAYSSITLKYHSAIICKQHKVANAGIFITELLQEAAQLPSTDFNVEERHITIPVCYEKNYAPDLATIAGNKNLTTEQVIQLHTEKTYRVFMLGFLPGFAYMGSVNEQLYTPRLSKPKSLTLAGSIGIAGEQTGIYPFNSPGGWNIIGRTPIPLFNAKNYPPTYLQPGDIVSFKPISAKEFEALKEEPPTTSQHACAAEGIKILKYGLSDSIQDLGRFGYQHLGINPTGAMDNVAMQIANALVNNHLLEAVIELHFPAATILFQQPTLIAISGADFTAELDGKTLPLNTPTFVAANTTLVFKRQKKGSRCYIAVHGGLAIEPWLNSKSTNTKAGAGGYNGRNLLKNDCIAINKPLSHTTTKYLHVFANAQYFYSTDKYIRVIAGNEFDYLTEESQQQIQTNEFTISTQSNRMGYQLSSQPLTVQNNDLLVSSAVTKGTIQLLPSGQLIVLMAGHQTSGGYPKVAHVISADISKLAQYKAGENISFKFVSATEAEQLFKKQQLQLLQLQDACSLKLQQCNIQ
jgi:antagonist of KipI